MDTALTREQIRRVDQLAIERYGIHGLVLMENAGRHASSIIHKVYGPGPLVSIVCGVGNNGGDGCVIARHLHNSGWRVRLMVAGDPDRMTDDTRVNHAIIEAMKIEIAVAVDLDSQLGWITAMSDDEVIVDALLGTGFRGEVRSPAAQLIEAVNAAGRKAIVAIDVPSGLDCNTGQPSNATIRADLTITFVAVKVGFSRQGAAEYTGRVEVADIGVPRELLSEVVDETG